MTDIRTSRLRLHAIDVAEGERIVARSAGPADAWADDFPFEGDVGAVGGFLRAFALNGEQRPFGYYRVTRLADGLAIGGIGFKGQPDGGCVEIGYGLVPSARGDGYAAEAVIALLAIAADHGLSRVIADTTLDNIASQRTLIRAGFNLVNTDAECHHYEVNLTDTAGDAVDLGPESRADGEMSEPLDAEPASWPVGMNAGLIGAPGVVFRPHTTTPLDEEMAPEDEAEIPPGVLWPMKQQRGFHPFTGPEDRFRVAIGEGERVIYAIDDGSRRAIIGWPLGPGPEGMACSVVGKVKGVDLEFTRSGQMTVEELLSTATGFARFSTLVAPRGGVSNVLLIETYGSILDVPSEYLPPDPPTGFP